MENISSEDSVTVYEQDGLKVTEKISYIEIPKWNEVDDGCFCIIL